MGERSSTGFIFWLVAILLMVGGTWIFGTIVRPQPSPVLRARHDARSLKMSIEIFDRTYGRLPQLSTSAQEFLTDSAGAVELLVILLGKEEVSDSMQNKRQIPFASFRVNRSKKKGGLVYRDGDSSGRPEGLYDSWGNPFFLRMDTDRDGRIEDPFKKASIIQDSVIVYSYGKDGKAGGGDDIQTW